MQIKHHTNTWARLCGVFTCVSTRKFGGRFKLIPSIVSGPFIVRKAVGNKPALLGRKVTQRYFRGPGYVETDVGEPSMPVYCCTGTRVNCSHKRTVLLIGVAKVLGPFLSLLTGTAVYAAKTIVGDTCVSPLRVVGASKLRPDDMSRGPCPPQLWVRIRGGNARCRFFSLC